MNQPIITGNDGELVVPVVPTTLAVYRNLRIGLAITAVMLTASIIIQSTYMRRPQAKTAGKEPSAILVHFRAQRLCRRAPGTRHALFVYRGTSDTENALLTLAGVAG